MQRFHDTHKYAKRRLEVADDTAAGAATGGAKDKDASGAPSVDGGKHDGGDHGHDRHAGGDVNEGEGEHNMALT